ncbi:MoaD/ThiS family protein [Gulosibacter sp. 10]|uniref:MoaD/ThiS family protein n=1 Tax=Gulosibacter sp. 10 TaxID=1255570 RepID=UPI00097EF3E7|nr:MoaD/ThiS family protein [Gulosibacter sp. 10]SJM70982.1 hypothetical protein FM112_15755 [Gulosibacter sp. 10]
MREVRLFAAAADAAGLEETRAEAGTVEALRSELAERFGPEFAHVLEQCSLLAEGRMIDAGPLPPGRVDVLPPFAGG